MLSVEYHLLASGSGPAVAATGALGAAPTTVGQLLVIVGVLAVCITIGVGVSVMWRRWPLLGAGPLGPTSGPRKDVSPTPEDNPVASVVDWPAGAEVRGERAAQDSPAVPAFRACEFSAPARRLCLSFSAWLAENEGNADLWTPFDQWLRETLGEQLGAARIRCYHVSRASETLVPLSAPASSVKGPSARAGILGHAATAGKEYVAGDAAHGPLVDNLAAETEEHWAWAWPVCAGETVIGLVAVGSLHDPAALRGAVRETAGPLLTLFWQLVAGREELRNVRRLDRGTGVLTRADFFTLAGHALTSAYQQSEPVVVTALAIEGLRQLDDTGRWQERDALVERIGQVMAGRVRGDDLVGRFADDRFVVLLRRLDSGLGRLIAEQLAAAVADPLRAIDAEGAHVRVRIGLAGSGFGQPALQEMLVAAFAAIERARHENLTVVTDLRDPQTEGRPT